MFLWHFKDYRLGFGVALRPVVLENDTGFYIWAKKLHQLHLKATRNDFKIDEWSGSLPILVIRSHK